MHLTCLLQWLCVCVCESNSVSFPQLWFVVRKLMMITNGGQYSEDNFRRKSMGKLLMLVFACLNMVV